MYKKPAEYWRENKEWPKLIGKRGTVIISTQVSVTSPELQQYVPYSFAIVEIDKKRYEFMGEKNQVLAKGDQVKLFFRKIAVTDKNSLISYGVKVTKV